MPADTVRVEVVEPGDWQAWRGLRLEAVQDTPIGFMESYEQTLAVGEQEWQERLARPGIRLVAYDGDRPVGIAGGFRDHGGDPVLFSVYVTPAARGGSVLAALVERVRAWAGPDPLVLDVHVDNARARRAYEKLGFALTGDVTASGGIDGRDLQRMRG